MGDIAEALLIFAKHFDRITMGNNEKEHLRCLKKISA
jgi:hypothetical protein